MWKSAIYLITILLISSTSLAQNNNTSFVENHYIDYFKLNNETIYTHLNKSKFLYTEELWFKSYIYNTKTQSPYLTTTNVYAAIYDTNGELVEKKMLYSENGMTHGNFKLSEYQPGLYYLKVSTNWMRNFNEKHYSLQQFEVLGEENTNIPTQVVDKEYDFQLLPEGGHLVTNIVNTIGYKILNTEGNGVIIESGTVIDSNNNIISTFKSNEFGIGKFNILIETGKNYSISAALKDGSIINKVIPKAKQTGITISVNNLNNKNLFISLKTNKNTLPNLINKPYFLLIHRDGLLKSIPVIFEKNKLDYIINIPKSSLFLGINILTLFNEENKPIIERLIYNHFEKLTDKIEVVGISKGKDSTVIRLKTNIRDTISKNISVSILPASSKSYDFKSNIITSFLLEPYTKGAIEKPEYYFKNDDRKTIYDLDLLLLTQGWSRYSWHTVFNNPPKAYYHFEAGMQIKGKVNNTEDNTKNEIILYSSESALMLTSKIDSKNYFSFENIFLIDSTNMFFSMKDKKGRITKPVIYSNIYPNYVKDKIDTQGLKSKDYKFESIKFQDGFSFDKTTILDTVSVTLDKKFVKPKNTILRGRNNTTKINLKDRYDPFSYIIDVIRDSGFDIINNGIEVQVLSRRAFGFSGRTQPNIYIDNRLLGSTEYFSLSQLMVNQVEEIFISRSPSVSGGHGGNINIFTKKGYSGFKKQKQSFSMKIVKFGFSLPETYYSPYYNKTHHSTYSDYGVLNWFPNLSMNAHGEFVFKIPNYTFESINLYIEGMAEDGKLLSKIEVINIE